MIIVRKDEELTYETPQLNIELTHNIAILNSIQELHLRVVKTSNLPAVSEQ